MAQRDPSNASCDSIVLLWAGRFFKMAFSNFVRLCTTAEGADELTLSRVQRGRESVDSVTETEINCLFAVAADDRDCYYYVLIFFFSTTTTQQPATPTPTIITHPIL